MERSCRWQSGVPIILPYNEIKVGKGQHNDSEKRRHGSMKNGLQHMLEGNLDTMIFVANAGDKSNQDVKWNVDAYAHSQNGNDGGRCRKVDSHHELHQAI